MIYRFPEPLVEGIFLKREKRFLAHVQLPTGEKVIAHSTNTGSLKSCLIPGAPVLLSPVRNPARKTRFTWEAIRIGDTWVGVNTQIPNKLVYLALKNRRLPEFRPFDKIRTEVTFANSRFDIYMENGREKLFAEIKNVTYREGEYALFPDAPTSRGLKHLYELIRALEEGYRAAMIYIVPRTDTEIFAPAAEIHPEYARVLREAHQKGLEIYPYRVTVNPQGADITGLLPFELRP